MTSFFALICLSLAIFSSSSQADLIGDVCSKSVNPTLCNSSLRSDPRSRGADLRGLSKVAVDQSISATSAAVKEATSLLSGPTKDKAKTCVDTFNSAIGRLNRVKSLLPGRGLSTDVNAAFSDIGICESAFGRDYPPQLKNAGFRAQGLVNVLAVIVASL